MLPLADWVMRGRGQALAFVIIALITSPIVWPNSILVAAVISLVWLRIGVKEGLFLSVWAILPAAVLVFYFGSFMPLLMIFTAGLSSQVLKVTRSWSLGLMSLSVFGLVTAIGLDQLAGEYLNTYVEVYSKFLNELTQQVPDQELSKLLLSTLDASFIAGLFGTLLVIGSFLSLVLARSWQAKLYNPGGFQQEFHQLRLGKVEVILAVLLTVVFYNLGMQYLTWVWIVLLPLLIAGVALCHALAARRKIAIQWYILFYCVLAFWDPLKIVLVLAAIVDSTTDIRSKLPQRKTDTD